MKLLVNITDGGTGICFSGDLDIKFEFYIRYGFSPNEIVRMAIFNTTFN